MQDSPAVVSLSVAESVAVISVDSPPVNALSSAVRQGLMASLSAATADPNVRAIVLICKGRTFFAGADIREFGKPPEGPGLRALVDAFEQCPKPVVAAIHGTALGGGLELALGCHYRVAVGSAKVGLPEVQLGLLPGAGGTQRLPRLVGVEAALDLVVSGRHVPADEAARLGLIDAVYEENRLPERVLGFARQVITESKPLRRVRDLDDKVAAARSRPEIFDEFRRANARRIRNLLAAEYCIRCVEAAVNQPFDAGLAVESKLFGELVRGEQSKAQRYAFFAEREAAKVAGVPKDAPQPKLQSVGIVGAGTMGGGIAMNFANVGVPVTIVDVSREALERGLAVIRNNYAVSASKGKLGAADIEQRMSLLTAAQDFQALAGCDLIIEAVFEDMVLKKDVFRRLDTLAKPDALLASNTSYLDINEIAAVTRRPEQIIGLHFFSPANVMKLLEIVRGRHTAPHVVAAALQLAKHIRKVPVVVGVCHGFVGNRMLRKRHEQADGLLFEGAMPWDIDRVLYDFGMPMGPYAMADLAGLDIGWSREASRGQTPRDRLCELDRRGQKTGAGFYDYDSQRNPSPSPLVEKIILELAAERGIRRRSILDAEILERCLYPMINEGAKILEEGIAARASDIDVVWVHGYGWPVYRGGPMFYADSVGAPQVLSKLEEYQGRLGSGFEPAALLRSVAAQNKRFTAA